MTRATLERRRFKQSKTKHDPTELKNLNSGAKVASYVKQKIKDCPVRSWKQLRGDSVLLTTALKNDRYTDNQRTLIKTISAGIDVKLQALAIRHLLCFRQRMRRSHNRRGITKNTFHFGSWQLYKRAEYIISTTMTLAGKRLMRGLAPLFKMVSSDPNNKIILTALL